MSEREGYKRRKKGDGKGKGRGEGEVKTRNYVGSNRRGTVEAK